MIGIADSGYQGVVGSGEVGFDEAFANACHGRMSHEVYEMLGSYLPLLAPVMR